MFKFRKHRNRLDVFDNLVSNELRIPLGSVFLKGVWAKESNDVGAFPLYLSRWRVDPVFDFSHDPESRVLDYGVIVKVSRKRFRLY